MIRDHSGFTKKILVGQNGQKNFWSIHFGQGSCGRHNVIVAKTVVGTNLGMYSTFQVICISNIFQDYITYWGHRIFHLPFLYKNFHKLHHTYKQPTAFSATAIHPVEFLFFQFVYISPMFIFTIHFGNCI